MANKDRLALIQGVITRMAQNSFMLKGWTVALVAAILAFAAKDADRSMAFLVVYIVISLGLLDAYYLAVERSYRRLYEQACTDADDDWNLSAENATTGKVVGAVGSASIWLFYLPALLVSLVIGVSA